MNISNGNHQLAGDPTMRVSYQFGDKRMEAEGPIEEVNRHTAIFLAAAAPVDRLVQLKLPMGVKSENDTPILSKGNDVPFSDITDRRNDVDEAHRLPSEDDFIKFFAEKSPQKRYEEIAVITYYYVRHLSYEALTIADYEKIYKILERVPVSAPSSMKDCLKEYAGSYLQRVRRGVYRNTLKADNLVENLGKNS